MAGFTQEQDGPPSGPLEARAGGLLGFFLRSLPPVVPAVMLAVIPHYPRDTAVSRVVCGLLVLLYAAVLVRHFGVRAKGVLVRFDEAGITAGGRTARWEQVGEVRLVRKNAVEALVFLPRDAADAAALPTVPTEFLRFRADTLATRVAGRWGSPLAVNPAVLDVSRTDVIDAVRRFGGLRTVDAHRELVVS